MWSTISERVRALLPDRDGLTVVAGFVTVDQSRCVDLDTVDPGVALTAPGNGHVAVLARTVTDLRRASSLAALLPLARRVVVAVTQPTAAHPVGVLQMSPELAAIERWRNYRGQHGEWALDVNLTSSTRAGEILAAVIRGLFVHRPLPIQRVALAGPGVTHWRPGDPDAIPTSQTGPLDELRLIPPADLVVRMVGDDREKWLDDRIQVVDRPLFDSVSWTGLGRAGALSRTRRLVNVIDRPKFVPPVDERSVNPIGFLGAGTAGVADVKQVGDVWVIEGGGIASRPIHPNGAVTDADVAALRTLRGLRIEFGRHSGPVTAARTIGGLACAGIPMVATALPAWARDVLGPELARVLADASADDVDDDLSRELLSIKLRRAGLRSHSAVARWRDIASATGLPVPPLPKVSVLLCTMRPDYVAFALAQVARQRHVDLELILVLHRISKDLPEVARATAAFDRPLTVLEVPDDAPLGAVLNVGARHASGHLLAKWDDDDWYSPDHLADLALAMDYSGAELVGSPHHLTYLNQINLSVWHSRGGSEQYNKHIAGGTLLIDMHAFRAVSGFRAVPRREDMSIQRAVIAAGGRTYRSHGLGYMLCRRESGHSWNAPITHFMRNMTRQWRGLYAGPLIPVDLASAGAVVARAAAPPLGNGD